jgi:PAS domain S-box-containing protein
MKDNVDLQGENDLLAATVQELKLEIAYHLGETKRLLCERDSFKRDLVKMAALFKGWLIDFQSSKKRCLIDTQEFFKNLVKNPPQNISDIMQINDLRLLITSCQAPYYIEHSNKAWTLECGWENHEVGGLTCAFLQGELTDVKKAAAFTKDVMEVGYGNMQINNYRKNGEAFSAQITVFPIYDSFGASESPVLTHFASILSDITTIDLQDPEEIIPLSISKALSDQMIPKHVEQITDSTNRTKGCDKLGCSKIDRRLYSRKFDGECNLNSETFEFITRDIRMSDLLRLSLSCTNGITLKDIDSNVIHCNKAYVLLTGYTLRDIEGTKETMLFGSMTDHREIKRCNLLQKSLSLSRMTVVNYRKDGSMFYNYMTTVPIRAGYDSTDVTHFCSLSILSASPPTPLYESNRAGSLSSYKKPVHYNTSSSHNAFENPISEYPDTQIYEYSDMRISAHSDTGIVAVDVSNDIEVIDRHDSKRSKVNVNYFDCEDSDDDCG